MDHENDNPIKTDVEAARDFKDVADPAAGPADGANGSPVSDPDLEEPDLTYDLRPPAPAGPGLGGMTPGPAAPRPLQVSPQLRDPEPEASKPPARLVKKDLNNQARKGYSPQVIERGESSRENSEQDPLAPEPITEEYLRTVEKYEAEFNAKADWISEKSDQEAFAKRMEQQDNERGDHEHER